WVGGGWRVVGGGWAGGDEVGLGGGVVVLGVFGAIYPPVGTAMVIAQATLRGRSLAFNGVCGNLGVALAAGITALITYAFSWRGAFVVPGLVCLVTAVFYLRLVPDDRQKMGGRTSTPDVAFAPWLAAAIFGLFA